MIRVGTFYAAWLLAVSAIAGAVQPVCLTRQDAQSQGAHSPLLVREIFRQGVLVAAREQLGLSTRDQVLREPFPEGAKPIDLQWKITQSAIEISLIQHGQSMWHDSAELQNPEPMVHMCKVAAVASERFSRSAWPDVLRKAGYGGQAEKELEDAAAPPEALANLAQLDVVRQFEALRQTHAAITSTGSSPQRLGVLVQGYANMGRLTDALWCADGDVFAARSIVYAQRMVAAHPKSAYAYWHRAYAFALAGCHKLALDDLKSAGELIENGDCTDAKSLAKPGWVGVIDAFCRYDLGALSSVISSKQEAAPLAALLRFFCVEFSDSDTAKVSYEQESLRLSPGCERLLDAMNINGGLGVMAVSTRDSFELLHKNIGEIADWSDLPAAAKVELNKLPDEQSPYQGDSKIAAALAASADDAEPSFSILGRLFQEQMFSNVFSGAYLQDHMYGVDATEFVESNMPLIRDHPYHDWLRTMAGRRRDPARYRPLAHITLIDPMPLMFSRINDEAQVKTGGANPVLKAWDTLVNEHDSTAQAMEVYIGRLYEGKDHTRTVMAHHLLAISPYDAIARAVLIVNDYDSVAQRVKRWTREDEAHPAVLMALANHYINAGDYEQAKEALRQRIAVMPDVAAFTKLADVYLKQKDEAGWLKEMQDALQQPMYGLERPNIQVQIANHYMEQKKFKDARPYAEAAAESYAAFGMTCAIQCEEALGDWDAAAKWVDARGDRYGNAFEWYAWCRRTGHGDFDKATSAMKDEVSRLTPESGREELATAYEFYFMQKDYTDAIKTAHAIFDSTGDTWAGMHLALLLDRQGERAEAENVLKKVQQGTTTKAKGPARKQMLVVAGLLHDSLAAVDMGGAVGTLDLQAVKTASVGASARDQGHIDFFVAQFLKINKQSLDKVPALLASAADAGKMSSSSVLAAVELREQKPASK